VGFLTRAAGAAPSRATRDLNGAHKRGVSRTLPAAFARDSHGMRQTVLIVDDHPGFRRTARVVLQYDGYEVVGEAADASSGLRESRRLRPAIVLLDVGLGDESGLDLAARLTAEADAPAVVLVSSRDEADLGPLIERSGARGFIGKAELSAAALDRIVR
jgi:DNA-binding NarL/FixJ family response regulator